MQGGPFDHLPEEARGEMAGHEREVGNADTGIPFGGDGVEVGRVMLPPCVDVDGDRPPL